MELLHQRHLLRARPPPLDQGRNHCHHQTHPTIPRTYRHRKRQAFNRTSWSSLHRRKAEAAAIRSRREVSPSWARSELVLAAVTSPEEVALGTHHHSPGTPWTIRTSRQRVARLVRHHLGPLRNEV